MFPLTEYPNYVMSNDLSEKHTDENEGEVGLLLVKEPSRRDIAWRITTEPEKPIHVPRTSWRMNQQ